MASVNVAQVAIGHRVRQVVFQPQRSLHYRLKHEVRATLNSVSGPDRMVFSVFTVVRSLQRCLGQMTGATLKFCGVHESSALRFASYL